VNGLFNLSDIATPGTFWQEETYHRVTIPQSQIKLEFEPGGLQSSPLNTVLLNCPITQNIASNESFTQVSPSIHSSTKNKFCM